MWGWGRTVKDDDSNSAGNDINSSYSNQTNTGSTSASPRGGGGTNISASNKKHGNVFSKANSVNNGSNSNNSNNNTNSSHSSSNVKNTNSTVQSEQLKQLQQQLQHQRRRSWTAGKDRHGGGGSGGGGVRVASDSQNTNSSLVRGSATTPTGTSTTGSTTSTSTGAGDVILPPITIIEKASSTYSTEGYSGIEVSLSHEKNILQQQQQLRSGGGGGGVPVTTGTHTRSPETTKTATVIPKSTTFNLAASFATAFHSQKVTPSTPSTAPGATATTAATGSTTKSTVTSSSSSAATIQHTQPSMSVQYHITERQKVYRAQFQSADVSTTTGTGVGVGTSSTSGTGIGITSSSALSSNSISGGPASPRSVGASTKTLSSAEIKKFTQSNDHRLPLFTSETINGSKNTSVRYEDALIQLRDYYVPDEVDCVTYELEQTEKEIAAIERDRQELERYWSSSTTTTTTNISTTSNESNNTNANSIDGSNNIKTMNATILTSGSNVNGSINNASYAWDINRALATTKNLSVDRIKELHTERGLCVTVSIESTKAFESLLSKCGGKATTISAKQSWINNTGNSTSSTTTTTGSTTISKQQGGINIPLVTTLRPATGVGGDSGAGSTIQQICLMKSTGQETSFFISNDNGHSYQYGRLPDRLYRRLRNRSSILTTTTTTPSSSTSILHPVINFNNNNNNSISNNDQTSVAADCKDILYLSTGPFGSYFTEFRSGECWWGLTNDDDELDTMLNEWDVYKIAFGPCVTIEQPNGRSSYKSSSWILIARDGRAAWKNLPSRLHNKLSSRLANESSPIDVTLGCEGSYYIRFLDGTSDWQLPSRAADICNQLEEEGSVVTSVSLHPELSHDFILRHS